MTSSTTSVSAVVLALCVLVGCSADSPEPAAPSSPTSASADAGEAEPARIPCGDDIGVESAPTEESHTVVDDAVALPSLRRPALRVHPVGEVGDRGDASVGEDWFSAKQGLALRGGHRVRLSVPDEAVNELRFAWGHGPLTPATVVTAECASGSGWLAFPGGYWVREPACYPVDVRVDRGPSQRVEVGVGAPCPGQDPPPET